MAKSKEINVVKAKRGTIYVKLAKQAALDKVEVEQLRLLNGEPEAGKLIKIVQLVGEAQKLKLVN